MDGNFEILELFPAEGQCCNGIRIGHPDFIDKADGSPNCLRWTANYLYEFCIDQTTRER